MRVMATVMRVVSDKEVEGSKTMATVTRWQASNGDGDNVDSDNGNKGGGQG